MYTQCPVCKTVFRLRPEQLDAAQGQVRCSRCQTVFNAIENLFQQAGATSLATEIQSPADSEASPSADSAPESHRQPAPAEASPASGETPPADAEEERVAVSAPPPAESPDVEETFLRDALAELSVEEDDGLELPEVATSSAGKEALGEVPPEAEPAQESAKKAVVEKKTPETPRRDARTAAAAGTTAQKTPLAEILPLFTEQADEPSSIVAAGKSVEKPRLPKTHTEIEPDEAAVGMPSAQAFDEELLSLFTEEEPGEDMKDEAAHQPSATPSRQGQLRFAEAAQVPAPTTEISEATTATPHEEAGVGAKPLHHTPSAKQNIGRKPAPRLKAASPDEAGISGRDLGVEPTAETNPPSHSPQDEPAPGPIPLRAERSGYSLPLEQEKGRGGLFGTLLWGSGILLMLGGLGLQYLYYHRMALAEDPSLRPLLEQMCKLTACQLPPRRDLSKIELGNHLVQYHPRYEHSLLITATLVNRADFNQPFPIVEVVMTDLEQRVVARRRFLPAQYLVGDNAARGMNPGEEVPLMLEVLDPGKNAVGFEFNFY